MHSPASRVNVLDFVNNLKKGGLFIIGDVVLGGSEGWVSPRLMTAIQTRREQWQSFLDETKFKAFVETVVAPTLRLGAANLMLAAGLGGMKTNTVVMGFLHDSVPDNEEAHSRANSIYSPRRRRSTSHAALNFAASPENVNELTQVAQGPAEYVGLVRDIETCGSNLLVLRNFGVFAQNGLNLTGTGWVQVYLIKK